MSIDQKLKAYMQDNFDFSSMKKVGIFPKEMKFNDYEGQAKIICTMAGRKHANYQGRKDNPVSVLQQNERMGQLHPG